MVEKDEILYVRRLKKHIFLKIVGIVVLVLWLIRLIFPGVMKHTVQHTQHVVRQVTEKLDRVAGSMHHAAGRSRGYLVVAEWPVHALPAVEDTATHQTAYHRVYSVPGYEECFPDSQKLHEVAAARWGVDTLQSRDAAGQVMDQLVYVGSNPYYDMDNVMEYSIPYLVPRASQLLQNIGRAFMDSLAVKNIPLHKIVVTSVLRTRDDIQRLQGVNGNAVENSCHRYGTTFDITYNRYNPVSSTQREVPSDTLKWVLSEVLRDQREHVGTCYVKYERKQSCFHITVR